MKQIDFLNTQIVSGRAAQKRDIRDNVIYVGWLVGVMGGVEQYAIRRTLIDGTEYDTTETVNPVPWGDRETAEYARRNNG